MLRRLLTGGRALGGVVDPVQRVAPDVTTDVRCLPQHVANVVTVMLFVPAPGVGAGEAQGCSKGCPVDPAPTHLGDGVRYCILLAVAC